VLKENEIFFEKYSEIFYLFENEISKLYDYLAKRPNEHAIQLWYYGLSGFFFRGVGGWWV
jgi:hypothetical protein